MLQSRNDLEYVLNKMIESVEPFFCKGNAYLNLGHTSTKYDKQTQEFEGFARMFWGIAPALCGKGSVEKLPLFIEGIKNGTNPNHQAYWGNFHNRSQKLVESAALAFALIICKEEILRTFCDNEKDNLFQWLNSALQYTYPENNWQFFRVLICLALHKNAYTYEKCILDESLDLIESFYLGDGWYSDGKTQQRDYYISFAFHYYSLIYIWAMRDEDPKRCAKFEERAKIFAKDFIYFFDYEGRAIPYGRSMIYRFAQCAFWSACVFADIHPYSLGIMKGIIIRNLRWWLRQDIFYSNGVLSIGYGYENLVIAEDYNGCGSPYWALKSFLILAKNESDEFWKTKELPLPDLRRIKAIPHAMMLAQKNKFSNVVYAGGQYADFEPGAVADKYCKFAYSSAFTFNISRDCYVKERTALDSTIAIEDSQGNIFVRRKPKLIELNSKWIMTLWTPYESTDITTVIIPVEEGHIRVHKIQTNQQLHVIEGGYPVVDIIEEDSRKNEQYTYLLGTNESTQLVDLIGDRKVTLLKNPPNSNLLFANRTWIPCLEKWIHGKTEIVASLILENSAMKINFDEYKVTIDQNKVYYKDMVIDFER